MKYQSVLSVSRPQRWLLIATGTLCAIAFPLRTEKFAVKFLPRAMTIQTSRRDPPRVAFNELLESEQAHSFVDETHTTDSLSINLNETDRVTAVSPKWISARNISLKPMLISRERALAEIDQRKWLEDLPKEQRDRLMESQVKFQTLDSDWTLPSWRQELEAQVELAKQEANMSGPQKLNSEIFVASERTDGSFATPEEIHNADVSVAPASNTSSNYVVQGSLRLQNGLALGDGRLELQHVQNGVPQSVGIVDLKKGIYKASVPDYGGTLIASLYDGRGQKTGEGTKKLSELGPNRFGTPDIVITPVQNSLAMHFVDFNRELAGPSSKNHYGDRGVPATAYFTSFDTEAKSEGSGVASFQNLQQGSWTLVRGEKPEYAESLSLVRSGEESTIVLFKESIVRALIGIANDFQRASYGPETQSVVWGQIRLDGKPISGVKVGAELQESALVVYFNALMIPDITLKATSENGYFAILHLPEGMHSVLAQQNGRYFTHGNVAVEPGVVSPCTLESSSHVEPVSIKVFDAFSGSAKTADLEVQSLNDPLRVQGFSEVYFPQVHRLSLLKSEPLEEEYLPTIQPYEDLQDSINVPLIERSWIQKIRAARKIDSTPDTSIIVGFVQGEAFDVYLPHVPDYNSQNIIYFSASGEVVESGTPGGGFILFNVLPGTQSVVIVSRVSNLAAAQIIPVDLGITGTLQFKF